MDAIKKWWAAKGKAYAIRALHTAWQGAGGLVIAAVQSWMAGTIDWRTAIVSIVGAALLSVLKSVAVGAPETREKTNE